MISVRLLRQIFVFGIVGISATVTNYLIAILAYEYLGLNIYASQFVGYIFAVMVSLFGHSKITFDTQLTSRIILKFIGVSLTTLMFSEIILLYLEHSLELSHRLSLLVVVITIPIFTFFISKLYVFR
jgi:putative flippase GtrA